MLREYEVVKLKHDLPAEGLTAGATGTVLLVYDSTPPAYEVEFTDDEGKTLALLTLNECDLESAATFGNQEPFA